MRGAEGFGEGIAGGLSAMGEAFEKAQEKKKQRASQGKAADAFVKANPDFIRKLGMDEHDWALLSPDEKASTMEGGMKAQAFAEGRTVERERLLRIQEIEGQLAAQKRAADNESRFPDFAQTLADRAELGASDFGSVMRSAADTGYQPKMGELDDLMRASAARDGAAVDWEDLKPREGATEAGVPYIFGKGGQFQFVPQDRQPDSGSLRGQGAQFIQATDQDGNAIPGVFVGPGGKILERKIAPVPGDPPPAPMIEEAGPTARATAPAAAGPKPKFRFNPKTRKLEPIP